MEKGSTNDVLNNKWELKKMIGKGSFSSIYVAKSITEQKSSPHYYVAIKRQSSGFETVIRWESDVLKTLSLKLPREGHGPIPVPRFIYSCTEFVAMELLSGEDMSALRNRVRNASTNAMIPIPSVAYLCINILRALQFIHASGYVHRDVKPANFVRRSPKSTEFCIIDFGITKQYLDKEGNIRAEKADKEFRGTTQYASPFVHIYNVDQCPRDDLFSLFFVMADMLCGQLPWTAATRCRDKAAVIESKREYFDEPSKFIAWIVNCMNEANEKIERSFDAELSLSQETQEGILKFFNHLKNLGYSDAPNYDFIEEILMQMQQPQVHNVKSLDYTYHGFSWKGGVDKLQFTSSSATTPAVASSSSSSSSSANLTSATTTVDLLDPQAIIRSKLQSLLESHPDSAAGKDCDSSLALAQRLLSLPQSDWSTARIFRNLLRELFNIPERKITRETVDFFRKVLVHHASFYHVEFMSPRDGEALEYEQQKPIDVKDQDEWAEFVDIQNLIGGFYDLCGRVHKRPRELVTLSTLGSVEGLMFLQDSSPTKRTPYR